MAVLLLIFTNWNAQVAGQVQGKGSFMVWPAAGVVLEACCMCLHTKDG